MPSPIVTNHAAERWIERVDGRATPQEARETILAASRAIEAAASFGCHVVRMANGAKLMLREHRVVTVLLPCRPWSGHQWGAGE